MTTNMDSPRRIELNQSHSHNVENIVLVTAPDADVGVIGVDAVPGYDTSSPHAKCCVVSTSNSSSTSPFDTPPLHDTSSAGVSHPPHLPPTIAAHHENVSCVPSSSQQQQPVFHANSAAASSTHHPPILTSNIITDAPTLIIPTARDGSVTTTIDGGPRLSWVEDSDSASNFSQIHNFYHRDNSQFSTNASSTHLDFVYFSAIDDLFDEDIRPPLVIPRTVHSSGRSTPAASLIAEAAVRRESSSMNSRTGSNNMSAVMTTPTWQTNQGGGGGGSGHQNHYQGGVGPQQQGLLASACTSTNLSIGYHSLRDHDTTTTATITPATTTSGFYETTSLNVPERSSAAGQSGPPHSFPCYASPSYYQQPLPSITTLPSHHQTMPLHPQRTSNRGSGRNYDLVVSEQNTTVSATQMSTRRRGVGSLTLPPSRYRGSSQHSTSNTFPSNVTAGGGHNPGSSQTLQPPHSNKPQQKQHKSPTQDVQPSRNTSSHSTTTTTTASCFKLKYPPPPPSMQTYFVVGQALLPQVHSSVVNPLRLAELHTKPGTGDWSAGYGPEYAATVEDGLPASRELYDPSCEAFSKFYEVLMRWYQLTLKFNYFTDGRASVTSRNNNNSPITTPTSNSVHTPNGLTSSSFLEPMSSETPTSYHHLRPSANNLPNPADYATDFVGWIRELNRWWDAEVKPFVVVTQKRPAVVSGGGTLGSTSASPSYTHTPPAREASLKK